MIKITSLLLFVCLFNVHADEEFDFGETEISSPKEEKKDYSYNGNFSFKAGRQIGQVKRWMDLGPSLKIKGGLQKPWGNLKVDLDSEFNFSFKAENDDQDLSQSYSPKTTLRELYWQKSFGKHTFKIGKKIVVWGKADALVVTDVLTPKDLSLLFFTDIEKARIGQLLFEWDLFLEKTEINLYAIPFPLYDKSTHLEHPYSPLKGLNASIKNQEEYSKNKQNPEVALRINRQWEWGSAALLIASLHNRDLLLETSGSDSFEKHERYFFTGLTTNVAFKSFLLKTELAYEQKRPLQAKTTVFGIDIPYIEKKDFLSAMIGFDYNHSQWGNWLIEYSFTGPLEKEDNLYQKGLQQLVVLNWSKNFLNEDLTLSSGLTFYDHLKNTLLSLGARYIINDNWEGNLNLSIIDFAKPLSTIGSNFDQWDRADLTIKYSF